jgi:hypothetical protein
MSMKPMYVSRAFVEFLYWMPQGHMKGFITGSCVRCLPVYSGFYHWVLLRSALHAVLANANGGACFTQ